MWRSSSSSTTLVARVTTAAGKRQQQQQHHHHKISPLPSLRWQHSINHVLTWMESTTSTTALFKHLESHRRSSRHPQHRHHIFSISSSFINNANNSVRHYSSTASTSSSSSSTSTSFSNSLKKMVQPFIKKCHPDMAKQYGLAKSAQQINLHAIQNLNSYIDGIISIQKGNEKYPFSGFGNKSTDNKRGGTPMIEIEFVMAFGSTSDVRAGTTTISAATTTSSSLSASSSLSSSTTKTSSRGASQPSISRRRVELIIPPPDISNDELEELISHQMMKLLRMADLSTNNFISSTLDQQEQDYQQQEYDPFYNDIIHPDSNNDNGDTTTNTISEQKKKFDQGADDWMAEQLLRQMKEDPHGRGRTRVRSRPMSAYDKNRQTFLSKINWNKVNQLYDDMMADMKANNETKHLIRNNPNLRSKCLAKILSNISFTSDVPALERLVAYRRLVRILDEHFDYLMLEEMGKFWEEQLKWNITKSRDYNTSPSALRKRRMKKKLETGYKFTIHHDNSVTMDIPVDFRTEELIEELYRNINDFFQWTRQEYDDEHGLGTIFEK